MSTVVVPASTVVTGSTTGCYEPVDCYDSADCCDTTPCGPVGCDPYPCGPVDCCDPCCLPLPVARSAKARVSRGGGSKHEVNSGAAKTVGCKTSYEVPTCLGPAKFTSSRTCKVENYQQVKSGQFGRCSNTRKHKFAGWC